MNKKIRLGILGGGGDSLIGVLHRVASSMFDRYEIIGGVFNPNYEENLSFAKKLGLKESRIYKDFETMVEVESKLDSDERIEVVSVLTPNFLAYLSFPIFTSFLNSSICFFLYSLPKYTTLIAYLLSFPIL